MLKYYFYTIIFFFTFIHSSAIENGKGYINPMKTPVLLSGNFGELRSNHFHSGIDYRTQSVQGKPVMSIADGYVSKIGISPIGYGNIIYVTHPATGETSIYAHLRNFSPKIDSVAKAYQYANKTFNAEIYLKSDSLIVKQGEIIAYSGNSGSSAGPHLHFEIRNTKTEEFIDPLTYRMGVNDNVKPRLLLLKIYPQKNEGCVNGTDTNKKYGLSTQNGVARFVHPSIIKAWGKIGLGIKSYDYSNNSANIHGFRSIQLEVDGKEIFAYKIAKFKFEDTRYINSFIDYEEWKRTKSFIMKSFVESGNFSTNYEHIIDQGFINVNEERDYKIKYTVSDSYGNKSTFTFTIKGVKMDIPQQNDICNNPMLFDTDNTFESENIKVFIPQKCLYKNICFDFKSEKSPYYSDYYYLHSEYVPLHDFCNIAIKLTKHIPDTTKLVAGRISVINGRFYPILGEYKDSVYSFKTRDFGKFVIRIDTISPNITPVNFSNLANNPYISFKISDNMSGIKSYNAYIDDKWVLFTYDKKINEIRYYLSKQQVTKNKQHSFKLIVTDAVGNERTYNRSFYW